MPLFEELCTQAPVRINIYQEFDLVCFKISIMLRIIFVIENELLMQCYMSWYSYF